MTIKANVRRLRATIQRVEQQPYDFTRAPRAPRPSSVARYCYCQLSSPLGPATGSWPTLTSTSVPSINIYTPVAGALVLLTIGTVYNWRNVTWAAAKTCFVISRPDGSWEIIDQDC